MDVGFYRQLFKVSLALFIINLVIMPFLSRSGPEFVITVLSLVITGTVLLLCLIKFFRKTG